MVLSVYNLQFLLVYGHLAMPAEALYERSRTGRISPVRYLFLLVVLPVLQRATSGRDSYIFGKTFVLARGPIAFSHVCTSPSRQNDGFKTF